MKPTIDPRIAALHGKLPAAGQAVMAKVDRKPLAAPDWRRHIGQSIERALEIAHLTKQFMSGAMGYEDQSALSRWISAAERPHFDKLFAVDRFYDAWVIACAEQNPRCDVEIIVTIRRLG